MNAPKPQRSPSEDTAAEAESALREALARALNADAFETFDAYWERKREYEKRTGKEGGFTCESMNAVHSMNIAREKADDLIAGPIAPLLAAITAERTKAEEAERSIEQKAREVVACGLPDAAKWLLASKDQWHRRALAAEADRDRLAEENARLTAAFRQLLPFVDRAAGEGVMWLEDCDSPQMDAADLCIAAAEALGMELGDDAYSAILKQGEDDIRAARALTSTKGADDVA